MKCRYASKEEKERKAMGNGRDMQAIIWGRVTATDQPKGLGAEGASLITRAK